MKCLDLSSKNKHVAKSSIPIGLGSNAILLAAGILLILLFFSSSVASQDNASPSISLNTTYNQISYASDTLDSRWFLRMEMQLPEERKAAAQRYKSAREEAEARVREAAPALLAPLAAPVLDPGGVPHYFGPYPNYANSPMPKGNITAITVTNGGTGYSANPVVAITDVYGTGTGATATATVVGGVITAISIDPGASGSGYTAPIITITDTTGHGSNSSC